MAEIEHIFHSAIQSGLVDEMPIITVDLCKERDLRGRVVYEGPTRLDIKITSQTGGHVVVK